MCSREGSSDCCCEQPIESTFMGKGNPSHPRIDPLLSRIGVIVGAFGIYLQPVVMSVRKRRGYLDTVSDISDSSPVLQQVRVLIQLTFDILDHACSFRRILGGLTMLKRSMKYRSAGNSRQVARHLALATSGSEPTIRDVTGSFLVA